MIVKMNKLPTTCPSSSSRKEKGKGYLVEIELCISIGCQKDLLFAETD
jgi:hypothetical protein